ncbi:MAG: polysaccharide deacetylase family protein [Clostridia bacterium]|nr:polysaccharide deacetylase family protein [Clostridia bacterium]
MDNSSWGSMNGRKSNRRRRPSGSSTSRKRIVILMAAVVLLATGLLAWKAFAGPDSTVPTTAPSTAATPTTAPTTAVTPTSAPTTTAAPTTAPSTTPTTTAATTVATTLPTAGTHAGDAAYAAYDNTSIGWWFNHPAEPGLDIPSTVPASIASLMETYRGIWRQDTDEKVIYLTMDEGYEYNGNTTRVLDIAASKGIKINFFVTGDFLSYEPASGPSGADLTRRMLAEGHLVGSHTWSHPNQAEMIETEGVQAMVDDMERLDTAFREMTGQSVARFLRPPQGAYSERTLKVLSDIGYRVVCWSFAYRDWITTEQPDPAAALDQIVGELHPGAVYLLHVVSDTNVSILGDFIDAAHARGYRFALLSQVP